MNDSDNTNVQPGSPQMNSQGSPQNSSFARVDSNPRSTGNFGDLKLQQHSQSMQQTEETIEAEPMAALISFDQFAPQDWARTWDQTGEGAQLQQNQTGEYRLEEDLEKLRPVSKSEQSTATLGPPSSILIPDNEQTKLLSAQKEPHG